MTHAHMTKEKSEELTRQLHEFYNNWISSSDDINEDARDTLGFLFDLIDHEIERMPKW